MQHAVGPHSGAVAGQQWTVQEVEQALWAEAHLPPPGNCLAFRFMPQ